MQSDTLNVIPSAVYPHKNCILYKVTGPINTLKKQRWVVSYVPDPTRKDEEQETITINNNTNFVAGGLVFQEYIAITDIE